MSRMMARGSALWSLLVTGAASLGGCGDPLASGAFQGDVEIRLHGVLSSLVAGDLTRVSAGVIWLGYDALAGGRHPAETSTLPIVSSALVQFTFDVLDRPPSVGNYLSAEGEVIPWTIRLGRVVLFSDEDDNGAFSIGIDGTLRSPDRLVAQSQRWLLLYADGLPRGDVAPGSILMEGQQARADYQLLEVAGDAVPPRLSGRVVPSETTLTFAPPTPGTI